MKRTLLLATLLTGTGTLFAQTQIANSDFEQWETTTAETAEPINWNSFMTASGTWSAFAGTQLDQSTDVPPGSPGMYSAKITARDAGFGVIANGNMTLGRIEMGSTTASSTSNYNYSNTLDANFSEAFTDSPDSIYFWAKFTPVNPAQTARVSTVIHNNTNNYKDPNDVGGANTVATAIYNFPVTNGWQLIKVHFTYVGTPSNAAFILATFTTNSVPGAGAAADVLLIDDIQLVYYNGSGAGVNELENSSVHVTAENNTLFIGSAKTLTGTYKVYSSSGSLVQNGEIANQLPFTANAGVYFIHLTTESGTMVKKFMKN